MAFVVVPEPLAPSYEVDLFARTSPARPARCQDRLVAEKTLDSRQTPFDLAACLGETTFEVHLASFVGHGLADREPQHGYPCGGDRDNRSLQPSLELPPNPVHHGPGGERSVPSPATLQRLAMFSLRLDEQLGGREPVRGETADKFLGKSYRDKGQGVRPVGGRVESPANREVCGRVPESEWPLVETLGEAVGKTPFATEAGQYRALVQPGELAQRADPESSEHIGKLGPAEDFHREATEPVRRRRSRHDHPFARRQPCRERGRPLPPPCTAVQALQCQSRRRRRLLPHQRLHRPFPRARPPRRSNGRQPGQVWHRPRAW